MPALGKSVSRLGGPRPLSCPSRPIHQPRAEVSVGLWEGGSMGSADAALP